MSQIDLATNAPATKNMNPDSAEKNPGMMIRKMAAILRKNVPSMATFSADRLFFYKWVTRIIVLIIVLYNSNDEV